MSVKTACMAREQRLPCEPGALAGGEDASGGLPFELIIRFLLTRESLAALLCTRHQASDSERAHRPSLTAQVFSRRLSSRTARMQRCFRFFLYVSRPGLCAEQRWLSRPN
jgi:hypothetical protein